ncbi:MAG TPA: universal stress protein [Rubrivivax sp.]|nr:universal stress protein [Rubrivivax sp.]HPO20722.1 universal stress protein [Rubrivivax sp.]
MKGLDAIVAATDLSAGSKHALDRAASLAQEHGAALTLVHVLASSAIDALRRWAGDAAAVQAVEDEARSRLDEVADEARQRHALPIDARLVQGHAVQQVAQLAHSRGADLVVTGTRGAGFVRAGLLGSTAERIARRASQPVLMVRQMVHERYRRVLVPVDFSDWSLAAVHLADRVAPRATLVLMHAVSVPMLGRMRLAGVGDATVAHYHDAARAEARQQLYALAERSGLPAQRLQLSTPQGDDPWVLIAEEEQARDCDLVVIGRQGRHALDELLLGSTTRRVLAECSADVLVSVHHDDGAPPQQAARATATRAGRPG